MIFGIPNIFLVMQFRNSSGKSLGLGYCSQRVSQFPANNFSLFGKKATEWLKKNCLKFSINPPLHNDIVLLYYLTFSKFDKSNRLKQIKQTKVHLNGQSSDQAKGTFGWTLVIWFVLSIWIVKFPKKPQFCQHLFQSALIFSEYFSTLWGNFMG